MNQIHRCLFLLLAIVLLTPAFLKAADDRPNLPTPPAGVREGATRLFRNNLNSQPAPKELQENFEKFFTQLTSGDAAKAYDELVKNQPLAERTEQLKYFVEMTQQAQALYGKTTAFELVDHHAVGTRLACLTFISTHKRVPLRWRFVIFKPEKNWVLFDVSFDDGFKDWFE